MQQSTKESPAPVSFGERLFALLQYPLPHHLLSALMFRLTRIQIKWFKNLFIKVFHYIFDIDLSLAEKTQADDYPHFNAFFTRALRPGARPIAPEPNSIISPVDGAVSQAGPITQGRIFQAKGHDYSAQSLLGCSEAESNAFVGGAFTTIYLSPRDYHRIHMPCSGTLRQMRHIPGRLFSVNAATTRCVPGLFARNERVVASFDTELGPMAMVMVGALFVGSVETVWAGQVVPPLTASSPRLIDYADSNATQFAKGDEVARFNMGSTVILLFGKDRIQWDPLMQPSQKLQMGQRIDERR